MVAGPSLSVLVPTHARARSLAILLEGLAQMDCNGLDLEIVVVENGPSNGTQAVVEAHADRLPLRYLHVPRANKSAAQNFALEAGGLGDVVVFTDDDVIPDPGWLHAIRRSCARWPERDVFGGRIELRWPDGPIPRWARSDPTIRAFAYAHHDLGTEPREYGGGMFPYGSNWWSRRRVFDDGWRFDPRFGPGEGRRIAGDETQLLLRLAEAGRHALYVPDAVVHHPVRPDQLRRSWIRRRAWQEGRSRGAIERPPRRAFLARHPVLWRVEQAGRLTRAWLAQAGARLRPPTDDNVLASVRAARRLGAEFQRLVAPPDVNRAPGGPS